MIETKDQHLPLFLSINILCVGFLTCVSKHIKI